MSRTANTQEEFAREWIKEAKRLYGFYPLQKDYERLREIQTEIYRMIVDKAKTLDLPEGSIDYVLCPECNKMLRVDEKGYYCNECSYEVSLEDQEEEDEDKGE